MLLTTATPATCRTWVRQLSKEMPCEYRIWCHTLHPHRPHNSVCIIIAPTHAQSYKHAKHEMVFFCDSAALYLCVTPRKAQVLGFALPSPSLPKLCHEICIRIQYVGIQSQHTNRRKGLLPFPITVARPAPFTFQPLFHQYSAVDNLWYKLKLWGKHNYSWPPWVTLSQTQAFCLYWSSNKEKKHPAILVARFYLSRNQDFVTTECISVIYHNTANVIHACYVSLNCRTVQLGCMLAQAWNREPADPFERLDRMENRACGRRMGRHTALGLLLQVQEIERWQKTSVSGETLSKKL